jgi:hypothetical protein
MPRVTKADLERDNADLEWENAELKAELNKARERSRSRNRKVRFEAEPLSAAGYRALEIVCKHNRDPVIEEQRATIAKLRKEHSRQIADKDAEIADYRIGNGRIRHVLHAAHQMSDRGLHVQHQTVAEFCRKKYIKYHEIATDVLFGIRR